MPETTIEPSNKERSELSEITSKYVDSLEEALSLSRPVVEKLKMRVRELEEACKEAFYNIEWENPKEDEVYKKLKRVIDGEL